MKELLVASVLALSPAQAAGAPAQAAGTVKVYFSKGFDIPGKLVPVTRKVPHRGVARFAVQQLIAGPTTAERARGLHSELTGRLRGRSACGADFTIRIKNGTATLRFCRTVQGTGVGGDARVLNMISTTLKQFGTVKKVIVLEKDGRCLFDQTDAGRSCVTGHE
ncbi:GerMN domain-containing protein [Nonomuraea lactucae]|uniref:GerMN domain-containing protein n=1 Tax=Nonomuraea lactucae TaxID=2249762 RepID=UPI000DE1C179|nr:GerMN domain-containing protein [Nonomuraea lactucae]